MTEWDEFVTLDYKAIYDVMSKPAFIFDGKASFQRTINTPSNPHILTHEPSSTIIPSYHIS